MKLPAALRLRVANPRSIMAYLPGFSVVCLALSKTALHQTRYAESTLEFGLGTLTAYTLAGILSRYFPEAFVARAPEESELQALNLGR